MIIAAALGAVHQLLINWIPLILINAFVVVGFGVALAVASGALIKVSKCRNAGIAAVAGTLLGISALTTAHYTCYKYYMNILNTSLAAEAKKEGLDVSGVNFE